MNGSLLIEIGFRFGLGTIIDFRLCQITGNVTEDAEQCKTTLPLLIENEASSQNEATVNNKADAIDAATPLFRTQFLPDSRQKRAKLRLKLLDRAKCERCAIQARYKPGTVRYLIFCFLFHRPYVWARNFLCLGSCQSLPLRHTPTVVSGWISIFFQ